MEHGYTVKLTQQYFITKNYKHFDGIVKNIQQSLWFCIFKLYNPGRIMASPNCGK
jgi:hypothetical protein